MEKFNHLVDEITICLLCINLKKVTKPLAGPMAAQKVDEDGNLWFFDEVYSHKKREIKLDKRVQLFFAHPGKSSYMVTNGEV